MHLAVLSALALAAPSDLDEGLALAEAAFAGPIGCHTTTGRATWRHTDRGGWSWTGSATIEARLEDRAWHLEAFTVASGDPATRLTPLLIGTHSTAPLAYLESPRRWFDWPAPITAEPVRTWGQVTTDHVDHARGITHVVWDVAWRGHKSVDGALSVTLDALGSATTARIELEERRRGGCVLRRRGEASLDHQGRPRREVWHSSGRCLFRGWEHRWAFEWAPWVPCDQPVRR